MKEYTKKELKEQQNLKEYFGLNIKQEKLQEKY